MHIFIKVKCKNDYKLRTGETTCNPSISEAEARGETEFEVT